MKSYFFSQQQSLIKKTAIHFTTSKYALFSATLIAALAIPSASMAEHKPYADWQMLNNQQSDTELSDGNQYDSQYDNQGQAKDKSKRKRKQNWNRLADKLDLDDSQKPEFIALMKEQHKQRREIKKNSGVREAMDAVDTELQQSLASVLNDEQLAKFIDHQENRKKRRLKGHYQKSLNSEEQAQQL